MCGFALALIRLAIIHSSRVTETVTRNLPRLVCHEVQIALPLLELGG